ncbi:MAG: hypothetical protein ACYCX4_14355 [Bacillota bacterium]
MKNTLGDLNNHLFAQLERLGDEDLKGEGLQEEISRAKAISDIATQVIANGSLVLKANIAINDGDIRVNDSKPPKGRLLELLGG